MLASIIANLQNVEPVRPAKLPMVKIDRGGGGPSWPNYDIVDITSAIQLFPEIAGEDSFARAVRRLRWIGEALPHVKEARERREGAVFLAGAVVGDAAAEERHKEVEAAIEERRRLVDQLKIEQLVAIIDEVRGTLAAASTPAPAPASRGTPRVPQVRGQYETTTASGATPLVLALGIGVVLGVALTTSSRRARTRRG